MEVKGLLPLLLQLQQLPSQSKQPNVIAQKKQLFDSVKQTIITTAVNNTTKAKGVQEPPSQRVASSGDTVYFPLPVKSDIFKSALFFIRRHLGENSEKNSDGREAVFIRLDTANLGMLWITMESKNNKGLVVRFYAEHQAAQQWVEDILPRIKEDLEQMGYGSVTTGCKLQPNIMSCQDIDNLSGFSVIGSMLLDREV